MEKNLLISQLLQKSKDNAQQFYVAGFLLVFVLLIVLVVRPTVNGYVERKTELQETKILSAQYQKVIASINTLQSLLESNRSDFALLNQAIPDSIQMYQLTQDVQKSFLRYTPTRTYNFPGYVVTPSESSAALKSKSELKPYKILVNISSDYPTLRNVLSQIMNQRRVKGVRSMTVAKPKGASDSATLDMKLEVEAYYL